MVVIEKTYVEKWVFPLGRNGFFSTAPVRFFHSCTQQVVEENFAPVFPQNFSPHSTAPVEKIKEKN